MEQESVRLKCAGLVVNHWRAWAMGAPNNMPMAHALAMVELALNGETDPEKLGVGGGSPEYDELQKLREKPVYEVQVTRLPSFITGPTSTGPVWGTLLRDGKKISGPFLYDNQDAAVRQLRLVAKNGVFEQTVRIPIDTDAPEPPKQFPGPSVRGENWRTSLPPSQLHHADEPRQ